MNRPETTLFMLMSVDGKISTGDTDVMDFDRDLRRVGGVKEGLQQYYDLEQQTDLFSLNTGRVMAKIGVNERTDKPKTVPVSFVIIDNKPHLTESGITYLSKWVKTLYLVTTNRKHPAFENKRKNIFVIFYEGAVDFQNLFGRLKTEYSVDRLTIQSGGTLNAILLRGGFIDHLSIVVAPLVVGGSTTPTLVDGESLHGPNELTKLGTLQLVQSRVLKNSYLHLFYDVI
jgi:2,5-diamino-6-(ribosylamino)-4(3H)-pyrimidinone 5'-phosphate reductase